jgi:hypothetical protein
MTDQKCAMGCGRTTSAALCAPCTTALHGSLELAGSIAQDLDDAVARLMRHGGNGKRPDAAPPLPFDLRASDARSALSVTLATAIHVTLAPRAWSATDHTITGMARWLRMHLSELVRQPRAAEIATRIRDAVDRAVAVLEPPPERHPAGDCAGCGAQLLAELGADTSTCACGAVTTGIIAARAIRAARADVVGTPDEISMRLRIAGYAVAPGTIRMLKSRGRLTERPGGKYALSDVLDWARQRDERMRRGRPV